MLTQIQSKILPLIKSLLKSNIFQFIGDNIHIFKDLSFMQDQCEKVSKYSERSEVYLHKIFIKWTVEIPGLRKASYFQTKTYQHINKFHFLSLCFHFTSHIHTHRAKIPNVEKNAKKKKVKKQDHSTPIKKYGTFISWNSKGCTDIFYIPRIICYHQRASQSMFLTTINALKPEMQLLKIFRKISSKEKSSRYKDVYYSFTKINKKKIGTSL